MASIITLRAPSLSPSSSSSTTGWKYHVFLSFRGDDTRHGFTDHLCKELRRENILVFRDNEQLPRGGVIDLELMKAIKQSQFAIIVLSEKYADSTSCLDELDEINKCRETTGITVFPVFYHVDPSHVQNLTGIFATELAKHVTVEVERIENWKKALMEVGNIAGWECTRTSPETKVIEDIVRSICSKVELKLVKELYIREENKKRGLSCSVHKPPDFTVGLDVPLKVLKSQLLKEKEQQLLVTAPGGCGKTTLVTMLCQDEQIRSKFKDKIFFVPVTKNFNQMVIATRLFRHISDDQVPEFQSDEDAIHQLRELLMTQTGSNPVLLILDDVWSGSEFRLGKFMFDMPNYNILVTSRTTTLPGFSFTYTLNPLNDEDAMTLLCHSASLKDGSSHIFVEHIKKMVRCCGGFPLALIVNGKSLYGKPVEVLRSKAKNWSNGHSIFTSGSEPDLLNCLRKSLEFSDNDIISKEYFMDLGSFSEDQWIPVPTLNDIWVELYELDEDGIDTIAILHELATWNLINVVRTRKPASEINNYYNEVFVTQQNLLRELAKHESSQGPVGQRQRLIMDISGNTLPKWCTEQDQQLINARLLSISTDESFLLSWCNIQAPKVEVLILNFQTKNYSLPEFVEKMDKLKVLIINNYGFFPAELRNFQLLSVLPNLKRIRLEKVSIPSLCLAPVLLQSLRKISLSMCNIGQAFGNGTIQVSDALPNLMEISIDYCNDLVELPTGLCDVIRLKNLSITSCHNLSTLPKAIGKLVNLEVLKLGSCTDLFELPESIRNLHKLRILDISDCLNIRYLPKHIGELCNLKEIHMNGCLSLRSELPQSTSNLERLRLVICDVERAKLWEPIKEDLTNLEVRVAEKDINLNWLFKS